MGSITDTRGVRGRHIHPSRPGGRRALAVAALAALALAACGGDDEQSAAGAPSMSPSAATAPAEGEAGGDTAAEIVMGDDGDAAQEAPTAVTAAPGAPGIDLGSIGRDVIVEMQVTMGSDDIQRSVRAITARAAALGGGIASSDVDFGDPLVNGSTGSALLVVKVPPASVDELVAGLDDAGTVYAIQQSAQDVTDQLVDLDVRIENARASVASVRAFMERTQDLTQLVALEGELTRRQTELEQLEAQQRNLTDRVALATVTIQVVPTAALPEPEPDGGIAGAFGDGWRAFVAVLYGIAVALAILAPFLVAAAAVLAVLWLVVRRRTGPVRPGAPGTERTAPEPERDDLTV